jgi:hypothetical protein
MVARGGSISRTAGAAQVVLAALILLTLAFTPPNRGRMLLVPLNGQSINSSLLARLPLIPERPGPLPGSLLVFGSSEGQFLRLFKQGVLILAAPQIICGEPHTETGE